MRGAVGQTAADPVVMFAGDSELPRIMARTLDCPRLQEESRCFSRQLQRCPLDCTIVEGCRTLGAPNAQNTHQPHSCSWTKSVT